MHFKTSKSIVAILCTLCASTAIASSIDSKTGHVVVQAGGFWASQGETQNINIQGLVGNKYTVNRGNQSNGLIGLGYFIDGLEQERFQLAYGVNLFYLGPTNIHGEIIQEQLYSNLGYSYQVKQMPLYLAAKANLKTNYKKYNVTLDAGVGPNFMRTGGYHETPLNTFTLPENTFASHANVTFTATAGVGLRLNNVLGKAPLEVGYRFFYLGDSQLTINNNQLMNTLKTGSIFSNAIVCSIMV